MKITKIQYFTAFLLVAYLIWEIMVWEWAKKDQTAIIRVDLLIIYPVLLVFIIISLYQFWKKNK